MTVRAAIDIGSHSVKLVELDGSPKKFRVSRYVSREIPGGVHATPEEVAAVEDEPWIDPSQAYRGETLDVEAYIRIDKLAQPWMPAPSTPTPSSTIWRSPHLRTIAMIVFVVGIASTLLDYQFKEIAQANLVYRFSN